MCVTGLFLSIFFYLAEYIDDMLQLIEHLSVVGCFSEVK